MSEGEFVDMRPYLAKKNSPEILTSSDITTRSSGCEERPKQQRTSWHVGISYPVLHFNGCYRLHPALKAASPQAPIADWFIGDDFHHNGALFLPHAFNFLRHLENQDQN